MGVSPVASVFSRLSPETASERTSVTATAGPAAKCTSILPFGSTEVAETTQPSAEIANPDATGPVATVGAMAAIEGHRLEMVSARLGRPGWSRMSSKA